MNYQNKIKSKKLKIFTKINISIIIKMLKKKILELKAYENGGIK